MDRTQGQSEPGEDTPASSTGPASGPVARVVTLTAADFTLTVNPVDGSEIEPLRPGTGTQRPAKRGPADRAERDAAARPPALPGATLPGRLLLEREEERERLVRLLGRGRSVRLTGPAGSGRSALLDSVALACESVAPDGVVRLSGHGHQQPAELLQALYAAVYEGSGRRPDRTELLARVKEIGAVVLLDDLELGGAALDELLRATPECAYLLAATPDTTSPSDDSHLEEVFLGGLGRADCVLLLEALTGRALTEEETAWAGDLRFASEGLPLRFVQAAALLRQRDELNRTDETDDEEEPGVFEERPREPVDVPLPTLAEAAAPAELLASRVSESARAALRIACALGGEMPHHAHLPALVGDTHADVAVAELLGCGLLTPVGPRYRLAPGVARQLEEAGYGESAAEEARTAARHYVWWTGHASVTPERVAAEADAVLAALAGADVVAAVLLARTAAPAFAASLHWEAWERVLRSGAEAARKAGEVAEQAYFHHELGVLALCEGRLERARAELEASIGLRGALADKRGTVAGRRALALVTDREAAGGEASPPLRLEAPVAPVASVSPLASVSAVAPVNPVAPVKSVASKAPVAPAAATGASAPSSPTAFPPVSLSASPAAFPAATPPASAPAGPVAAVTSAGPPALPSPAPRGEPVTQVVPVIQRGDQKSSSALSDVFDDAFPPTAKPAAPPAAPPPPPAPASRRRTALLAAAGAVTVAVLGTVVALAMAPSDHDEPQGPAVSSTPTSVTETSGNVPSETSDPEPGTSDPADPADPSRPTRSGTDPDPGTVPGTGKTPPARTPSGRPSSPTTPRTSTPPSTPVQSPTSADPKPSTSSGTPEPTATTGPTEPTTTTGPTGGDTSPEASTSR
ncbi:ATP-binding protein [Streptomyces sp. NPDC048272]|uniref:ATP-binding protein n=1 Tax=Streptomyces sp. NPDC048272 TaxID=3154616 RepID=UPI0034463EB7